MAFTELLQELNKLNLPKSKFAIFGSSPLAIRKIREANDLDIVVKPDLWKELSTKYKIEDGRKLHIGNVEVFKDWKPWFDDVNDIINSAEMIDNLPFVKLEYVIKWKKIFNRGKDKKDIRLIQKFLKK